MMQYILIEIESVCALWFVWKYNETTTGSGLHQMAKMIIVITIFYFELSHENGTQGSQAHHLFICIYHRAK